jgi:hypothetical protein
MVVLSTVTGEYGLSSNSIFLECVSFHQGSSGNVSCTATLIMCFAGMRLAGPRDDITVISLVPGAI